MKKYYVTLSVECKKSPDSRFDDAIDDIRKIGYRSTLTANNGQDVSLPENTFAREVDGNSHSLMQMRIDLQREVVGIMAKHAARGRFYLAVSTDWDWASGQID